MMLTDYGSRPDPGFREKGGGGGVATRTIKFNVLVSICAILIKISY